MNIKPSVYEAINRLRLDNDLLDDLEAGIEQVHAEALAFMDRPALYPDAGSMATAIASAQTALDAATLAGDAADIAAAQTALEAVNACMVVTADIIAAQLLLLDVAVGSNTLADREEILRRAESILRRHRRAGV